MMQYQGKRVMLVVRVNSRDSGTLSGTAADGKEVRVGLKPGGGGYDAEIIEFEARNFKVSII